MYGGRDRERDRGGFDRDRGYNRDRGFNDRDGGYGGRERDRERERPEKPSRKRSRSSSGSSSDSSNASQRYIKFHVHWWHGFLALPYFFVFDLFSHKVSMKFFLTCLVFLYK